MRLSNVIMYIRYYVKNIRLHIIRKFKGLDFEGRVYDGNPQFNGYEGCYPVRRILRKLKISNRDSILDIGCGKGLFVYYARRFGFARIDGLEYSNELFNIAKSNMAKIDDARIHLYNCDAREFGDYADYSHFFLCNPFSSEVMEIVLSKILESRKENMRKITIYYQFPFYGDLILDKGFELRYGNFLHGVFVLDG